MPWLITIAPVTVTLPEPEPLLKLTEPEAGETVATDVLDDWALYEAVLPEKLARLKLIV